MKNLLIVGAGGFGREVLAWVTDHPRNNVDWKFSGFLDNRAGILDGYAAHPDELPAAVTYEPEMKAQYRRELRLIGDPLAYAPRPDDVFLVAIGDPGPRRRYAEPLMARGAEFIPLVHGVARVATHVSLGRGSVIGPFASVSPDVRIGEFVSVNSYTGIAHDVSIGDWTEIDGHCLIAGRARIGSGVRIHGGAIVTPDAEIGDGATVGAGSVVFGRVPPGVTVIGNPARRFEFRA